MIVPKKHRTSTSISMSSEILQKYIYNTYPHLAKFITPKQYKQINWIDTTGQTNERMSNAPNEPNIHKQQQRIFAKLHFLYLLRDGSESAHKRFVNGQKEPKLTLEHFNELSFLIKCLTEEEFNQLWVATTISRSVEANKFAENAMKEPPPFDSVEFLAKAMTLTPEIYPAAKELMAKDKTSKQALDAMFNTGHYHHMMYVEGDPKMFNQLRNKIQNGMQQKELNLWLAYWLIDIAGFRAQTNELGSEYCNDNTYKAFFTLKNELDLFFHNTQYPILYNYLNERANWLGLTATATNTSKLFAKDGEISRLILARIAAMQRLFTPEEREGLVRGLNRLKKK